VQKALLQRVLMTVERAGLGNLNRAISGVSA
jgi:hypothetical protein